MTPEHLIAAVLFVFTLRAFLKGYRSAGRPEPIRVRTEQRPDDGRR